jgi:hypothetical protein
MESIHVFPHSQVLLQLEAEGQLTEIHVGFKARSRIIAAVLVFVAVLIAGNFKKASFFVPIAGRVQST